MHLKWNIIKVIKKLKNNNIKNISNFNIEETS